ncbi:toll-like receptor 4 [Mytilus californianus]|uniref:toll-like receptor 4 n=1 Tax=Mytilus californianus TaxID=6549 RepID=UPI002247DF64|nr:toll-like receptor 4 [Mytilus californianus]
MSDVIQGLSLLNFKIIGNDETFYYRCSTNRKCKCSNITDGILADCSALTLKKSPYFEERVVSVNLSRNLLTHLPDEGHLPAKLKYLDLADNNISKFSKGELAPFSTARNIISLNLSTNFLSLDVDTYYTGVFQNLKYLQYLDVSNNSNANKSYYCPDKVFQELSSLQSLSIDGVQNVTFGKGFSTLTNLTMLRITGIAVKRIINREYFDNFPNLEHLDLSATLEWRNKGDFALTNFEKGALQKLTKLQYLDISYHRKLRMCGFRNVTNDLPKTSIRILKANYLECERSVSTVLFVDDIKSLNTTKLEELYLDGNNLEETDILVPRHLPPSLHYFSARDNRWVIDRYAYHYISALTGIKTVDLSFQNKHQFSQSKNFVALY